MNDCSRFKSSKFRQKECPDPNCDKNDGYLIEDVKHIMFRCPADKAIHRELLVQLHYVCPPALYKEIVNMGIEDKTVFFLSAMGNSFVQEWSDVYSVLLDFICEIYDNHVKPV